MDQNKAHAHDGVSVRMLKLNYSSVMKPLLIILHNCLEFGTFPNFTIFTIGKSVTLFQYIRKIINKLFRRPLSLLPVCSKVFEKVVVILFLNVCYKTTFKVVIFKALNQTNLFLTNSFPIHSFSTPLVWRCHFDRKKLGVKWK